MQTTIERSTVFQARAVDEAAMLASRLDVQFSTAGTLPLAAERYDRDQVAERIDGALTRGEWTVPECADWTLVQHHQNPVTLHLIFELQNAMLEVQAGRNELEYRLGARTPNVLQEWAPKVEEILRQALQPFLSRRQHGDQVGMVFWYDTRHGAVSIERELVCPKWQEIRDNYFGIQEDLDRLVRLERPFDHAKIIFWHGPPGTGKTYALRALLRAWSGLSIHVITDPEQFFEEPSYLYDVLFSRAGEGGGHGTEGKLIVLEDAADLVLQESRASRGFQMGRLLNASDGLLGQGLQVVFLVTTNEPAQEVDRAVTRPGRCLSVVEFRAANKEEALAWLGKRGLHLVDDIAPPALTLAELYMWLKPERMTPKSPEKVPVGFVP